MIDDLVDDGMTLLLTTQYLEEADRLADRVLVVDAGRRIAEGTPAELKSRLGADRLFITLACPESDLAAAREALTLVGVTNTDVEIIAGRIEARLASAASELPRIVLALANEGIDLAGLSVHEPTFGRNAAEPPPLPRRPARRRPLVPRDPSVVTDTPVPRLSRGMRRLTATPLTGRSEQNRVDVRED